MGVRIHLYGYNDSHGSLIASLCAPFSSGLELLQRVRHAATLLEFRSTLQAISSGHRRWWIGSFLDSIRHVPWRFSEIDVLYAEELFLRLLRGHGCGVPTPGLTFAAQNLPQPWLGHDDSDCRMATLTDTEFSFLQCFIEDALASDDLRFCRPPGPVGIAPERDDEWNEWVREAAVELARPGANDIRSPSLIAFIV